MWSQTCNIFVIHIKWHVLQSDMMNMLLKLDERTLMNSWKVCYPKRLDSLMNSDTLVIIICMDSPLHLVVIGVCEMSDTHINGH